MFKLTKGDENNLEGKVEIYARLDTPEGEKTLSAFATVDALTFIEEFGLPPEEGKNLEEKANGIKKDNSEGHPFVIPTFMISPRLIDEIDILVKNCDALYVGKFFKPETCSTSILLATQLYIVAYHDQMIQKAGAISEQAKQPKQEITAADLEGSIKNYILTNYVIPMLDSNRYGETKKASQMASSFIGFAHGSKFEKDALELCALLRKETPNLDLINLYLDKIDAIKDEKYEVAAEIRNQIAKLTQPTGQ